jgi:ABC-type transport system substrate-binding protein
MLNYYIKDSKTVLNRNENWFGVGAIDGRTRMEPFVEQIKIKIIPDSANELEAFKKGALDICDITMFPEERKKLETNSFVLYNSTLNSYNCLVFNLGRPYIGGADNNVWLTETDKGQYTRACAVRKAICYIIDRAEINEAVYDGSYAIIDHPYPPLMSDWYSDDIIRYKTNKEEAWEWMKAAGYFPSPELIPVFTFTYKSLIYILGTCLLTCLEAFYYNRKGLKKHKLRNKRPTAFEPTIVSSGFNQSTSNSKLNYDKKRNFLLNSYLR